MENDLRKIESARVILKGLDAELDEYVSVNKYGSSLLIEIPMMILFMSTEDIVIELF